MRRIRIRGPHNRGTLLELANGEIVRAGWWFDDYIDAGRWWSLWRRGRCVVEVRASKASAEKRRQLPFPVHTRSSTLG